MTDILLRLQRHRAQMAPHQTRREAGVLLTEAMNEIVMLRATLLEAQRLSNAVDETPTGRFSKIYDLVDRVLSRR